MVSLFCKNMDFMCSISYCTYERPPVLQCLVPVFGASFTPSSKIVLILLQKMLNDFFFDPKLIHLGNLPIILLGLNVYKDYDDTYEGKWKDKLVMTKIEKLKHNCLSI